MALVRRHQAMSADPNKKSARTFQCRDVLWETFEQLAHELECSVDYLVNEAMKQYARQRSQGAVRTPYPAPRTGDASQPATTGAPAMPAVPPMPSVPAPAPMRRPAASGPLPAPPSRAPGGPGLGRSTAPMPLPPPRGLTALGAPPLPPGPPAGPSSTSSSPRSSLPVAPPSRSIAPASPPMSMRSAPPPLASSRNPPPAIANGLPAVQGASLSLVYNGERYSISKDRFVIGRGKQSSDLTLKDPNVSRQHALVEFQNGVYYMVDMGSTNGVTFNGDRVARKAIAEGDVFRICDHDLLFTFR